MTPASSRDRHPVPPTGQKPGQAPVVLILSHPQDVHVHAVRSHLDAAGVKVHFMDTRRLGGVVLPVLAHLHGGHFHGSVGDCDLAAVTCVWHRRPSVFEVADGIDAAEVRAGVGGILATLPYLNHPADMAAARFKPLQLATASRCGLDVPETVIGSDLAAARDLAARRAAVVKPLSARACAQVVEGDRSGWQRPVHMTQQCISKTCDVRVTVVDETLFAVEIRSPHLDWRADPDACTYTPTDVPEPVAKPLLATLRALRLRYAACDFSLDRDGRWWFLEANSNGQWLWLETELGLPISNQLAEALIGTHRAGRHASADLDSIPTIADGHSPCGNGVTDNYPPTNT